MQKPRLWPSPAVLLSGCRDLNPGPLVPQTNALTKLRHSPFRGRSVDGGARAPSGQSGSELVREPLDPLPRAEAQVQGERSGEQLEVPRDRAERFLVFVLRLRD